VSRVFGHALFERSRRWIAAMKGGLKRTNLSGLEVVAGLFGVETFILTGGLPVDKSGTFQMAGRPVMVVDDRAKADFIMTGSSHVDKAGWAKTIFVSPNPHAEASITVKDARSGNLVFAYNVDKSNAVRANQSTAEACAKHLREAIEKK
jgi:hypothetical protein